MKWPFKKKEQEKSALKDPIDTRIGELVIVEGHELDGDELDKLREIVEIDEIKIRNINSLVEIDERRKKKHWWNEISPNTVLIIAGNVLLTVLVTKHEDLNVITSKAKQFWLNLRQ